MTGALEVRGLSVSYGGVQALQDVDLTVGSGQLVGLIGPNGAGKTTCIDAISGFTASTGSLRLGEHSLTELLPHQRARRGLSRTWQAAEVFEDLTVRENLYVAASRASLWQITRDALLGRRRQLEAVEQTMTELGIAHIAEASAGSLTEGQRKLVGVGRALVSRPHVVCLDEPAAGLDTNESKRLGVELRRLVDHGVGMLLVEHDMGLVMSVSDHVVVLNFGKVIACGPPEVIRQDSEVVEAYLGAAGAKAMAQLTYADSAP